MANPNVNPDALASKTFIVTVLGAILYISVVFAFVIARNASEPGANSTEPAVFTSQGY
jgi:hypothetical protein